jgi:hypothetical protein
MTGHCQLVQAWPIHDPTADRKLLKHWADLDMAEACEQQGWMPIDRARYFVCRSSGDVWGLRLSMALPETTLHDLIRQGAGTWPLLVGVVMVRPLASRREAAA